MLSLSHAFRVWSRFCVVSGSFSDEHPGLVGVRQWISSKCMLFLAGKLYFAQLGQPPRLRETLFHLLAVVPVPWCIVSIFLVRRNSSCSVEHLSYRNAGIHACSWTIVQCRYFFVLTRTPQNFIYCLFFALLKENTSKYISERFLKHIPPIRRTHTSCRST